MPVFARTRLIRALPLVGGIVAALFGAIAMLWLPTWRLEAVVTGTGLSQMLAAAAPPLGRTAQAIAAVAGAILAGAIGWSALYLMFGTGGVLVRRPSAARRRVRRADAHPDAPPRAPLSAAEIDAADFELPPPLPPEERLLPQDLDQPLAAFDPGAVRAEPRAPAQPPSPPQLSVAQFATLAVRRPEPVEEAEWQDAPTTGGASEPDPVPDVAAAGEPSIEALLARLERGAARIGVR